MTVTLNLPRDVEREVLAEAQAKGKSLDEWVREGLTLGDVSIKELIA